MYSIDDPEREGFQLTGRIFAPPADTSMLDMASKRKVTICNLFSNHRLSITDIVRILDESQSKVIAVLLEEKLIQERRRTPRPAVSSGQTRFVSFSG